MLDLKCRSSLFLFPFLPFFSSRSGRIPHPVINVLDRDFGLVSPSRTGKNGKSVSIRESIILMSVKSREGGHWRRCQDM